MRKSLFILNDKAFGGGAEVVMHNIVNRFCEEYEISVMTLDNGFITEGSIFNGNVKHIASMFKDNPYRRRNPMYYAVCLYNLFQIYLLGKNKYDIAVANKEGRCMKIVSQLKARKKIAWVHVDYKYLYWTKGLFMFTKEVDCMKSFDKVVTVSRAAAESIKEVVGDPGNLCVLYNPIEYKAVQQKSLEAEGVPGHKRPLFVAVGRVERQKNFKTLAKVWAKLSKEYDFEGWIIGDGNQMQEIENILAESRCDCVKLLGHQDNRYKFISRGDVLISTSLWESYGLVLQEALILGVPVITTKCPAVEECFDDRFGLMVDCDEKAIEEGMRYILDNPQILDVYKSNIEKYYKKDDLWVLRLEKIKSLFEE